MSESERDERVRRHEEVVGRLIRTILSRQRELNTLRDLKDQLFRGDISEQAVLSLLDSQAAPKRSLPEDYICIAPDDMPLVIEYLCGTGAESDREVARIHLGLCERCTEMEKVIGKVATRMRDRCVAKVREKALKWQQASNSYSDRDGFKHHLIAKAAAANELAEIIEVCEL